MFQNERLKFFMEFLSDEEKAEKALSGKGKVKERAEKLVEAGLPAELALDEDMLRIDPEELKKVRDELIKGEGLSPTKGRHVARGKKDKTYLTPKQERYCKYRVEGFSRPRAYEMAFGPVEYPSQSGYLLEKIPTVNDRLRQLKEERANTARLVDPQESMARWNDIYQQALQEGDRKGAIEAQKQIDRINGAEKSIIRLQTKDAEFSSDGSWKEDAARLIALLTDQSKL